jgi:hypothetical protein
MDKHQWGLRRFQDPLWWPGLMWGRGRKAQTSSPCAKNQLASTVPPGCTAAMKEIRRDFVLFFGNHEKVKPDEGGQPDKHRFQADRPHRLPPSHGENLSQGVTPGCC